jgi:pyruvate formate lyase activating enzyme
MKTVFKYLAALLFLIVVVGVSLYLTYGKEKALERESSSSALHEAMYYEKLSKDTVQCVLCPNRCILGPEQWGICKARKNIGGKLYSMVYQEIAAAHTDPIEKKPFFHVLPGSKSFSIATTGCNLRCIFCQNWQISQIFPGEVPTQTMTPEQVVQAALYSGADSIAFTYTEPTIFYEYMLDIAKLAKAKGLKTVVVSAGFIEPEPLKELLQYIDAYKIDFKAFHNEFYQQLTGGRVEPILKAMKIIKESGTWLEVLNLIVPGQNDSEEEIRELSKWIKENLGDDVPVHFSRFFPQYKLRNLPPTPAETIIRAREIAMEEGLKFVYSGNVAYPEGEATYCPKSGEPIIKRRGHFITYNGLKDGKCPDGEEIPGVWK